MLNAVKTIPAKTTIRRTLTRIRHRVYYNWPLLTRAARADILPACIYKKEKQHEARNHSAPGLGIRLNRSRSCPDGDPFQTGNVSDPGSNVRGDRSAGFSCRG